MQRSLAKIQQQRIDMAYAKAQKRAAKKGRTIPPRQEYYDHWGYPYVYYGAYMYPMWWTAGMYYGAYPGFVAACGGGHAGGCAAGSCGGGVAAGACGGPGVSGCLFVPLRHSKGPGREERNDSLIVKSSICRDAEVVLQAGVSDPTLEIPLEKKR